MVGIPYNISLSHSLFSLISLFAFLYVFFAFQEPGKHSYRLKNIVRFYDCPVNSFFLLLLLLNGNRLYHWSSLLNTSIPHTKFIVTFISSLFVCPLPVPPLPSFFLPPCFQLFFLSSSRPSDSQSRHLIPCFDHIRHSHYTMQFNHPKIAHQKNVQLDSQLAFLSFFLYF